MNSIEFDDVHCIDERVLAIYVLIGEDRELWIPKSVIDPDSEVMETGDKGVLILPEWFCLQEGLV